MKPQLMQMTPNVSYVCTDPKGTIIVECGKMLVNGGYQIKVLNTINFKKSMHYNPFHYIRSEKDILKLVNTIIANTKGEGEKSTEDFWVKAERLLYSALIGYIWYEAPEEEQNFSTLLEFINASETREEDEEFKNAVANSSGVRRPGLLNMASGMEIFPTSCIIAAKEICSISSVEKSLPSGEFSRNSLVMSCIFRMCSPDSPLRNSMAVERDSIIPMFSLRILLACFKS